MEDCDGKTAKLWSENWVPGHPRLQRDGNAIRAKNESETMDSIIDSNSRWWNVEKIRALFNTKIDTDILKILICPGEQPDKWVWA